MRDAHFTNHQYWRGEHARIKEDIEIFTPNFWKLYAVMMVSLVVTMFALVFEYELLYFAGAIASMTAAVAIYYLS